jgi:hypothetical protein
MSMHNQYNHQPPVALHARLLGPCRNRFLARVMPLALATLILLADLILPSPADYGAFLLVPLLLATYCGGWKYGVALGWMVAVAEQVVRYQQFGTAISSMAFVSNVFIWGTVATLLVAITNSILETQELRESYIRLQTLQQTMVTVNDIVRNRLAVLLAMCDVMEEGRMPSARQLTRARAVIEEIVHQLDRLGRLEVVTVKEVAGVEAIDLDARPRVPPAHSHLSHRGR